MNQSDNYMYIQYQNLLGKNAVLKTNNGGK